ncbi:MAG: hypothetical protein CMB31_00995 [Euryarchaeota archaeon]|nr:hypothetical protein [Euryarchaeota archaeon]|tara:strand:- start:447 stop:689 length:243 start_codon:yes stop_codon:yes gene_type:complete
MELTMAGAYLGMVMVLFAFVTETRGLISSRSVSYLSLMGIGEILLTVRASVTGEWPFAVLGAIWAIFAIWSIFKPPKNQN